MPALLITCTALIAACVLFVRGNSCGHDFDFHLLSWMEVARAWHAGLVYPHWVQDANYGAGEPRLIFYPPASWLLGALLGMVTSWHAAPVLFVLLALLTAGGSMYLLAREWAPAEAATFAACLYVANPYAMFVAYERSAFGELLAAAWLPLMVLFALRRSGSIAPLGLSIAALWLTNSPAAVIGSYLLAVLALGMWIAEGRPWPALRAAGGMALGLGLAAFYIVPAAFEQRWVQIERAINPGMRVEDSFLFAHTANAFHDQVLRTASWILVLEFAGACVAAYLAWRKSSGRIGQDRSDRDAPGHSVTAIAGQRGDLEARAAPEVSAVSLALADGAERGRLRACWHGRRSPGQVAGSAGRHHDRRHGHRFFPALLPALRR